MQVRGDKQIFYATDLTNFIGCRHLTALDRLAAHRLAKRPFFDDPMVEILRQRGLDHERAYIQSLAESWTSKGTALGHSKRHDERCAKAST